MATVMTSTELAAALPGILNRVYAQREIFFIEHDGRLIASLTPLAGAARKGATWRGIVDALADLPRPDPSFADDLAAIQSEQPLMEELPWNS